MRSLRDPNLVAAIISTLTREYGDSLARLMLIEGVTLADLINSLLRSPIRNGEAIKLVTHALGSDDFIVEPAIAGPSHFAYVYDPPGSLNVVDIAIDTTHGQVSSKAFACACGPQKRFRAHATDSGSAVVARLQFPLTQHLNCDAHPFVEPNSLVRPMLHPI